LLKLSQKAREIAPKLVQAIKGGKYVSTTKNTKNIVEAINKAKQFNKLSKLDKFVGITVGGGAGVGMHLWQMKKVLVPLGI
jgi:hypothetical protein